MLLLNQKEVTCHYRRLEIEKVVGQLTCRLFVIHSVAFLDILMYRGQVAPMISLPIDKLNYIINTNTSNLYSTVAVGVITYVAKKLSIINNNSNYSIEEILDSSLDYFTDLNFLEEVLQKAKQEEKYELCSKILKRIKKIKDS